VALGVEHSPSRLLLDVVSALSLLLLCSVCWLIR